jgi:molybdate transport system ATP-binding protein
LRGIDWTIREGETWAIVGPVGSGKTTLAETLCGRHSLAGGAIAWPLLDRLRAAGRRVDYPSDVVRFVSFREESRLFSYVGHYYQERFDFADAENNLTLAAFLAAGQAVDADAVHQAARALGIESLLPTTFIKLSNGQVRRARIARALLGRPELLILDEPFMGLDTAGRRELTDLLGNLIRGGLRVVVVTRPQTLPEWVTHVAKLQGGTLEQAKPKADFSPSSLRIGGEKSSPAVTNTPHPSPARPPEEREDDTVIDFERVTVRYGDRVILRDITWTVRRGERWAVLGPNGAGKTTLLSLICGDHPQAYSNRVHLFGRQRGSGESIWEVKANVGLVSPELHLYFTAPLTAARTVVTGFFDVLTDRPTTREQDDTVYRLFAEFDILHLADRPFARLSTGEQRLVLLVRALVKQPPLLILDEPFQGLDDDRISRARRWLDDRLTPEQTLLFVTHYEAELPESINRRLRLDGGTVVSGE